jgi:hypothetical protein
MIATKTTTLVVTMALLGIVPVVAHAQDTVNITELLTQTGTPTQSGTAVQTSAPAQEATSAVVDSDTNTNTPINFAIVTVGPFSTVTSNPAQASTASDDDSNTANTGATQNADATQTQTEVQDAAQTQTSTSMPTFSANDLLGLVPGSG